MSHHAEKITFKGNPLTLLDPVLIEEGSDAPDCTISKSLTDDVKISDYRGKKLVLNVVPSLDTSVCSVQTAKFNEEAGKLGGDVTILTVSMDLPPAQARWCQANSADHIETASDYKHHDFAKHYGLLIKELGLLARSVFVLDEKGQIVHKQIVGEVTEEPNYEAALSALKSS